MIAARVQAVLSAFPWSELPSSVRVDTLVFVATDKPAIRFPHGGSPSVVRNVGRAAALAGWDSNADSAYVCLAKRKGLAGTLLALDGSGGDHTEALGLALGYPPCCCRAAAIAGEENIDRWAAASASRLRDTRIDPYGFQSGLALVSHVPCDVSCRASHAIADAAWNWLDSVLPHVANHRSTTEPWQGWHMVWAEFAVPLAARGADNGPGHPSSDGPFVP